MLSQVADIETMLCLFCIGQRPLKASTQATDGTGQSLIGARQLHRLDELEASISKHGVISHHIHFWHNLTANR